MYLGPLGGLTEINPLQDFPMSSERFGGVHTSVTGRRTIDVLGHRATYGLRWVQRNTDEMEFLEALHHRLIPGPLRLVFPADFAKNRLSRSAAAAGYGTRDLSNIARTGGSFTGPVSDWPSASAFPGKSILWSGRAVGNEVQFDVGNPVPAAAGETLTGSLWVKAVAADTLRVSFAHYTASGYSGQTDGSAVTVTAGSWTRLTVTATPAASVLGVALVLRGTAGTSGVTIGGAQVELGSAATQWTRGGGAPVVAVDQMDESALWSPYRNPEMTLLEL
ncbi:phage head spike fiber domain-containing protein [Saccharopolyspora shandongensis]|uniref:phage head spike fiber domain-containing protein n=1 Tax=Saccharopolyspora shandongensis TaxID=418495 RepID=UPI00340E7AC4